MILLNSVLVATDFSETSDAALTYGRNLARAFGAKLHVLHVAESVTTTIAAELYPAVLGDLQSEVEDAARKRLDALLTTDDRTGFGTKTVIRVSSSPAAAIVGYAKAAHIDLIVIGTHGRGAVSQLLMGSVAEKVVRTAGCPVMVVRPNEHDFIVPDPVAIHARI